MSYEAVMRFRDLIVDVARGHGLRPSLVAGLVDVESGGDPEAVSTAGAVGLMQVMPDTAIAGRPTEERLRDPTFNVAFGCGLLAELWIHWGTTAGMLAGYFGAIDGEGHPTSATDATGTDGWRYVGLVEMAALTYRGWDEIGDASARQYAPETGTWSEAVSNLKGIADDALAAGRRAKAAAEGIAADWGAR